MASFSVSTWNPKQPDYIKWMFGETTISYIKVWNHPIETTIYKWLFGLPGMLNFVGCIDSVGEDCIR